MPGMSHLKKNLEALSIVNPTLAARIAAMEIPHGFERVTGTDGTPTFRRVVEEGGKKRIEWLGATSMPAASAEGLVSSLDATGGGRGAEWVGAFDRNGIRVDGILPAALADAGGVCV
jgi:hypothetical protein